MVNIIESNRSAEFAPSRLDVIAALNRQFTTYYWGAQSLYEYVKKNYGVVDISLGDRQKAIGFEITLAGLERVTGKSLKSPDKALDEDIKGEGAFFNTYDPQDPRHPELFGRYCWNYEGMPMEHLLFDKKTDAHGASTCSGSLTFSHVLAKIKRDRN